MYYYYYYYLYLSRGRYQLVRLGSVSGFTCLLQVCGLYEFGFCGHCLSNPSLLQLMSQDILLIHSQVNDASVVQNCLVNR